MKSIIINIFFLWMIDAIPFLFNQSYAFIACFYIMKKILCEENAKYFLQFPQNLYVYLCILYHILDIFSNIRIICFKKGLIFFNQSFMFIILNVILKRCIRHYYVGILRFIPIICN